MISVYNKKTETELNLRKKESLDKYVQLVQWGRGNPTKFIEEILGIQLMDFQKNIILGTWNSTTACWCAARNSGKSFLIAVYLMARSLLIPDLKAYIVSASAKQADETFDKISQISKCEVPSLLMDGCMYYNEIVKSNSNSDGFIRERGNRSVVLYNGSSIKTIPANPETIRGTRANVIVGDEAAFLDATLWDSFTPFINQNADFKTGKNFDEKIFPQTFQNQLIASSSAGSVSSEYYKTFKNCMINMIIGKPGYYVSSTDCEMTLAPYINGVLKPPIANREEIEMTKETNPNKYNREYLNLFDDIDSPDSIVQRAVILRNEHKYMPEPMSTSDDKKYVLCWDPAVQMDNSFVLIAEIYRDEKRGLKAKVINGVNLVTKTENGKKLPLRTPQQVIWVQKLLTYYNGRNNDYTNACLRIDGGAGGGANEIVDYLMIPFEDESGSKHFGVYDSKFQNDVYQEMHRDKFPEAIDCLQIVAPRKYRTEMFGDLVSMVNQDLIDFPIELPPRGEIELEDGTFRNLTLEEMRGLLEIDVMKEEIIRMQQVKKATGEVDYRMPKQRDHDDRCYAFCLLANYLSNLRRAERADNDKPKESYSDYLMNRIKEVDNKKTQNPFAGKSNPFAGKKW